MSELRKVAEAATHGDWHVGDSTNGPLYETQLRVMDQLGTTFVHGAMAEESDARYVATFDPPMVLALLDVAESAEVSVSPKVMGSAHIKAGRDADFCDTCLRSWPCEGANLAEALARLREVSP